VIVTATAPDTIGDIIRRGHIADYWIDGPYAAFAEITTPHSRLFFIRPLGLDAEWRPFHGTQDDTSTLYRTTLLLTDADHDALEDRLTTHTAPESRRRRRRH